MSSQPRAAVAVVAGALAAGGLVALLLWRCNGDVEDDATELVVPIDLKSPASGPAPPTAHPPLAPTASLPRESVTSAACPRTVGPPASAAAGTPLDAAEALRLRGNTLFVSKRSDAALKQYQAAIDMINEHYPRGGDDPAMLRLKFVLQSNIVVVLHALNRHPDAIFAASLLLEERDRLPPDLVVKLHYRRALSLRAVGRSDDAAADLQQALNVPAAPEVSLQLVHRQLKEWQ